MTPLGSGSSLPRCHLHFHIVEYSAERKQTHLLIQGPQVLEHDLTMSVCKHYVVGMGAYWPDICSVAALGAAGPLVVERVEPLIKEEVGGRGAVLCTSELFKKGNGAGQRLLRGQQ